MYMRSYSKSDVILVRYPFTDLTSSKVRPAVVISSPDDSEDLFVAPLTSKTIYLLEGEFVLKNWTEAGLNVITAVKRGVYTIHKSLIIKKLGRLSTTDTASLGIALRKWLEL